MLSLRCSKADLQGGGLTSSRSRQRRTAEPESHGSDVGAGTVEARMLNLCHVLATRTMKSSRRARFNSWVALVASYHAIWGHLADGLLPTQCVGSRLRHLRSSFCGILLLYLRSGLVLDHSRYFHGVDS